MIATIHITYSYDLNIFSAQLLPWGFWVTVTLKSNLEVHVGILYTLAHHGPIYSSNFEAEAKRDGFTLKRNLEFLIQNRLVEKRPVNRNQVLYIITKRGQRIVELFQKITDVLKLECQNPLEMRC